MEIKRPEPHSKLPPDAKKVFEGIIFDVYQWEQELYDGTYAIFERLQRLDTVEVVCVLPDGKILLIDQEQPSTDKYVSLVAGRMEKGEEPLSAMKRELLEETGYEASDWKLWDAMQPVHKIDWVVYTFIAKGLKKVTEIQLDGGEKIEPHPVTFDEFLKLAVEKSLVGGKPLVQICEAYASAEKKVELRKLLSP